MEFKEIRTNRYIYFEHSVKKELQSFARHVTPNAFNFFARVERARHIMAPIPISMRALTSVAPFINVEGFLYSTSSQREKGARLLLECGEVLVRALPSMHNSPGLSLALQLIYGIVQRREFDIQTYEFNASIGMDYMDAYIELVLHILVFVHAQLTPKGESFNKLPAPVHTFCMKMSAWAYLLNGKIRRCILQSIARDDDIAALNEKHSEIKKALQQTMRLEAKMCKEPDVDINIDEFLKFGSTIESLHGAHSTASEEDMLESKGGTRGHSRKKEKKIKRKRTRSGSSSRCEVALERKPCSDVSVDEDDESKSTTMGGRGPKKEQIAACGSSMTMGGSDTSRIDRIQLYSFNTEELPRPSTFRMLERELIEDTRAWQMYDRREIKQSCCVYITKGSVQWSNVPGYYSLILPLLLIMRATAPRFSKRALETSKVLLHNVLLWNVMIDFTFARTNLFDPASVNVALNCCGVWLHHMRQEVGVHHLPACINFSLMFNVIDKLLSSDRFDVNFACLALLYNHLQMYGEQQRQIILSEMLLDKFFFKFLLHWNHAVRNIFCHILVFQVPSIEEIGFASLNFPDEADGADAVLRKHRVDDKKRIKERDDMILVVRRHIAGEEHGSFPDEWRVYWNHSERVLGECEARFKEWAKDVPNDPVTGCLVFPPVEKCKTASAE